MLLTPFLQDTSHCADCKSQGRGIERKHSLANYQIVTIPFVDHFNAGINVKLSHSTY